MKMNKPGTLSGIESYTIAEMQSMMSELEKYRSLSSTPEAVAMILEEKRQEEVVDLYRSIFSVFAEVVLDLVRNSDYKFNRIVGFDGLDGAGKGRTIREIIKQFDIKMYNTIAFTGIPTDEERFKSNWIKKYQAEYLKGNKQVSFFDRTQYNRSMVEAVMGYCSKEQYDWFMENINQFEEDMTEEGYTMLKILLDITGEVQDERLDARDSELKRWKISPVDRQAAEKRELYKHSHHQTLKYTSTDNAPWIVIDNNEKWKGVIEVIKVIINSDAAIKQRVMEELSSMKKKHKKMLLLLDEDINDYNHIDDVIEKCLEINPIYVQTGKQKVKKMETEAKQIFEKKHGRAYEKTDTLVVGEAFEWERETGW